MLVTLSGKRVYWIWLWLLSGQKLWETRRQSASVFQQIYLQSTWHHLYQLENGSKLSYVVLCSFQDGTVLGLLLNKIIEGAIPSLVSAKERNLGLEIKLLFAKNSLIEHYSSLIILLKILQIFFDNNFTENLFLFTLLQIERDKRRKWYDCRNTWKWATWSLPLPLFLQINTQIFCILKNCGTYFFFNFKFIIWHPCYYFLFSTIAYP